MNKLYINAEDSTMGRIASFCAKQALQGSEIFVLNSEKAIISGRKEKTIEDFKFLRKLNTMKPEKGPFFSSSPEKIMKRTIRGMLPDYRIGRGREAWKKIRCYVGIPEEFKKEKLLQLNTKKVPAESITLKDLGRLA
jgi:large subunit ribosomal protein L13